MRLLAAQFWFLFLGISLVCHGKAAEALSRPDGAAIYRNQCASCHGPQGEGVEDEYDEPLYGTRTLDSLTRRIHRTMPEDDPDACVDEEAAAVARYLYETFYTAEARGETEGPRLSLSRLTAEQYLQSTSDLLGRFREPLTVKDERGLRASYYDDRGFNRSKRKIQRVDPRVTFDFGAGSPDPEQIEAEAFAIEWRGAVWVERSGEYTFGVRSPNGFKLFVNASDDHPLIDGWVSNGEMVQKEASLNLVGGHAYPLRLQYFKFKDAVASIELRWAPPGGVERVIPQEHLLPEDAPSRMVVTTPFPADDRSFGYVRGTAVSSEWQRAITAAAIEVANHVVERLPRYADLGREVEALEPHREKILSFCQTLVRRAFRRPLTEFEKDFYVASRFPEGLDLESGVKRVVILALTSPRFLYPELALANDAHGVAGRMALILRDSLPWSELERTAAEGRLQNADDVRSMVVAHLDHPQTRRKLRGFFDHWLHLDGELDLSKDAALFPQFDGETMADWRRSLDLFVDDVMWSEASDYRQLLLANELPLNARLAEFLGHGTMQGEGFRKVAFDPKARAGVLTHPYLLARFAYHRSTSPIHRGVFMARNVLGRTLKPPPEAIEFEESRFDPTLTMREKVTDLTKADSCMACHAVINPLGFSLEHFDAVGRFRFQENDRPIDAVSDFETAEGRPVTLGSARDVARLATGSSQAQRSFVQHLFEHLVKQPPNAYGADTLDRLHAAFEAADFNMRALIAEIVAVAALHSLPTHENNHDDDPKT